MSPTLAAMFFKDSSLFLSPAHLIMVHFSAVQCSGVVNAKTFAISAVAAAAVSAQR